MVIGARLRKLRAERNLSQGDITELIGLPRSYISRIENGHAVPSLETLQRLAAALDVPLYRLFYDGEDTAADHPAQQSLDELADDPGPLGIEARFLIQMRDLIKKLERRDRMFLLNLARKLGGRKPARQARGGDNEPEGSSQKPRVTSQKSRARDD